MNGLVSSPVPPPDPDGAEVAADGWFPPVPLAAVRDAVRLGEGAITNPRLIAAMEGAMLHALKELKVWRAARALAGAQQLSDVTEDTLADRNLADVLWERAVRYFAAAELYGQHRDVSATDAGLDRALEKDTTADEFRRLALAAISDLLSIGGVDVPRNRVELI